MSMQGFGKPGVNFWGGTGKGAPLDMGFHMFGYSDNGWDAFGTVAEKAYFPEGNPVTQKTYRHLLPDIVMNPPVSWIGEGFCGQSIEQQFHRFTCPEEGPNGAPIKMIHRHGGSFISTMSETNKWVQMYQHPNLEFVVMQDCHWSERDQVRRRHPAGQHQLRALRPLRVGRGRRLRVQRLQQQPPHLHLPAQVHRAALGVQARLRDLHAPGGAAGLQGGVHRGSQSIIDAPPSR